MARLFVTSINLNKNELLNARIQNLSTAPSSPVSGQIYYNTSDNTLYFYNSTEWIPASGSTEVIQDLIGSSLIGGTGLTSSYDDASGNTTIDLDNTAVTAGDYGSTTKIPTFTVDAQGRLTAASQVDLATQLDIGADNAHGGFKLDLLTDSVKFVGGEGIDTDYEVVGDLHKITIIGEDATTSNKGIASFNSYDFDVTSGAVSLEDTVVKSVTTDSGSLTPSSHGISILGGEGVDVTHTDSTITVSAEDATSSNKGVASFDSTDFTVTTGAVALNVERVEDIVSNLISGGTGIDATYSDGFGTLDIKIDNTVVTKDDEQALTNKTLGSGTSLGSNLDANGKRVVNLGVPVDSRDAATKEYVDAVSEGLHIHASAIVATVANISIADDTEVGSLLDGVTLASGNRILVKNQTNAAENGIYVVNNSGPATRALDFDSPLEVDGGDFIFVTGGLTNGNSGYVQTLTGVAIIGTDPISFTQFSGAGTFLAGAGLHIDGNTFSVDVTPASGDASLTNTGGATEVKTDTSRGLSVDANGLGINPGTGLTFNGSGKLGFDSGYGVRKYAENVGDGTATSFAINHAFATRDVTVNVYENATPFSQVETDVEHTDSNNITLRFSVPPLTGAYRVVISG